MAYDYQANRIIAVLNPDLAAGRALNALGHLAFAAGHRAPAEWMGADPILDADGKPHAGISRYPFIVLAAAPDEIKRIVTAAKEQQIRVAEYPQQMFDTGPDDELVEALGKAHAQDQQYHAAVLVGPTARLKALTGHLKLYR